MVQQSAFVQVSRTAFWQVQVSGGDSLVQLTGIVELSSFFDN